MTSDPETRKSIFNIHPIFLIVLLSFALNLHGLAEDSFWGDEILTASFAGQSVPEVIEWTAGDIHPPLYYLVAGAFTRLLIPLGTDQHPTPASDWLWRFLSVLSGVLAVAITYKLSRHIAGLSQINPRSRQSLALSAALLLSVSPIAINYGQEARMHALFMFLTALSTWLLFKAIHNSKQWGLWAAFALATTASIYTMYFGFLIIAAQTGFVLSLVLKVRITHHAPRPQSLIHLITGFTAAIITSLLLYIPWWPVLFSILRKRAAVGAIEGGVGTPLDFVVGVINALGPMPTFVAWSFLALFGVGLIFLARHFWSLAVFGLLWLLLPVLLPIFLGDPRALQFRYAFVLPIYLIVVAYGVINISLMSVQMWCRNQIISTNINTVSISRSNFRGASILGCGDVRHLRMPHSPNLDLLSISKYFVWLLATVSFIATLNIYQQVKPNWREAAAYLNQHTAPADIILIGPLWDEGRFIDYYYRGQAQLLTPAALVTNIQGRMEGMRAGNGQVWAVNRFAPVESAVSKNVAFSGVVVSEPQLAVYESSVLTEATLDLAQQAVDAAYPWAAEAQTQGVLDPDPRTAQAAALRAWGDTLMAANRPAEALHPYQIAVDIFPGWVNGFIALAEAYEAVGNSSEAAKAYQQAVAFNLNWQGEAADSAAQLVEAGNWAAALEQYHQIIGQ